MSVDLFDGFEQLDTGQEESLRGATMRFRAYTAPSREWDHEHCAFCWQKFIDPTYAARFLDGDERRAREQWERDTPDLADVGYVTADVPSEREEWVCSACFARFAKRFGWKLSPTADWVTIALQGALRDVLLPMTSNGKSVHPAARVYPYRESLGEGIIAAGRRGLVTAWAIEPPGNWQDLFVTEGDDGIDRSPVREVELDDLTDAIRDGMAWDPDQPQWIAVGVTPAGAELEPNRPRHLLGPIEGGDILLPYWRQLQIEQLEVIASASDLDGAWEALDALDDFPGYPLGSVLWCYYDAEEAKAIQQVLDVIDRVGQEAADPRDASDWLSAPSWSALTENARRAADLLAAKSHPPALPERTDVVRAIDLLLGWEAVAEEAASWAARWTAYGRPEDVDDDLWLALERLNALRGTALSNQDAQDLRRLRDRLVPPVTP